MKNFISNVLSGLFATIFYTAIFNSRELSSMNFILLIKIFLAIMVTYGLFQFWNRDNWKWIKKRQNKLIIAKKPTPEGRTMMPRWYAKEHKWKIVKPTDQEKKDIADKEWFEKEQRIKKAQIVDSLNK
jgi:hypothetical protein